MSKLLNHIELYIEDNAGEVMWCAQDNVRYRDVWRFIKDLWKNTPSGNNPHLLKRKYIVLLRDEAQPSRKAKP